jgi:hypothetical protein
VALGVSHARLVAHSSVVLCRHEGLSGINFQFKRDQKSPKTGDWPRHWQQVCALRAQAMKTFLVSSRWWVTDSNRSTVKRECSIFPDADYANIMQRCHILFPKHPVSWFSSHLLHRLAGTEDPIVGSKPQAPVTWPWTVCDARQRSQHMSTCTRQENCRSKAFDADRCANLLTACSTSTIPGYLVVMCC